MAGNETKSGGRFLGIRPWIWVVAFVSILAVIMLLWTINPPPVVTAPDKSLIEPPLSKMPAKSQEPLFPPDPPQEAPPKEKAPPSADEMPYAIPTFEDPLNVTLTSRPELGQISVERYDSEGNPTGEPLKQGTQVQIPDPSRPGEKIYFRVP